MKCLLVRRVVTVMVTKRKGLIQGRASTRLVWRFEQRSEEGQRVSYDLRIWRKDLCKWVWGLVETQRVDLTQFLDRS
jgi:hypothetical protein